MDQEIAALSKEIKHQRKKNINYNPNCYEMDFTISEYVRTLMRSKYSHEYLASHKLTNEESKRGSGNRKAMKPTERKILIGKGNECK